MEPNSNMPDKVFLTVEENLTFLRDFFGQGINLIESKYEILDNHIPVGLAYIETVADKEMAIKQAVTPMLQCKASLQQIENNVIQYLKSRVITATEVYEMKEMNQIVSHILIGNTVIFVENTDVTLVIGTRRVEKKAVEAPENESTVLGSQESFTDDIKTNCSLIIKRLPVSNLKSEEFTVGTLSCTKVKLMWLGGIANAEVINEVRRRIQSIDTDCINGIGAFAEMIEDRPLSLFPKYKITERPDWVEWFLVGGGFAIICDNCPFAFIAPVSFWDNFRTMDDFEEKYLNGSYLKIIRYLSFVLAILISPLYLSFVTYNQGIVPANLALNIAQGRQGVPFPSTLELIVLTLSITIIREAGLRMPSSVGYFVGTLGAVLIGQSIVTAGYVSASLIIVVAVSVISSFAISTTTILYPSRILNYLLIILAACFGIFGVVCGLIFLIWYLITLDSFGMPYLYPLIPGEKGGTLVSFLRLPYSMLKERLKFLAPYNHIRTGDSGIKRKT